MNIEKLSLSLFKNQFKKADNHPDFKGSVYVKEDHTFEAGVPYDITVWLDFEKGKASIVFSKMKPEYAEKFKIKDAAYQEKKASGHNENRTVEIYPQHTEPEIDSLPF